MCVHEDHGQICIVTCMSFALSLWLSAARFTLFEFTKMVVKGGETCFFFKKSICGVEDLAP